MSLFKIKSSSRDNSEEYSSKLDEESEYSGYEADGNNNDFDPKADANIILETTDDVIRETNSDDSDKK